MQQVGTMKKIGQTILAVEKAAVEVAVAAIGSIKKKGACAGVYLVR